jgi:hypothetical protein
MMGVAASTLCWGDDITECKRDGACLKFCHQTLYNIVVRTSNPTFTVLLFGVTAKFERK